MCGGRDFFLPANIEVLIDVLFTCLTCLLEESFLTPMKNVSLCDDQCKAGWPASWLIVQCGKSFTVAIFLDIVSVINFKLCMMVELYHSYHFH